MEFNTTEEIIQDIAAGKMVILLDDEDRENEGDLVCAAELVDDKKINFMISKARGLVCLPLSPQKCDQLNLPMMTNNNRAKHGTGFTVSIEAAEGISTVPLDHQDNFTLLVAVLLSAQCTDERVNKVTPKLFQLADNPRDMRTKSPEEIYNIIKPCGLGPQKSKALSSA